jgi:N-dimethylarginine dimethylaminohydrolase
VPAHLLRRGLLHAEAQEFFERPVISLRLVDPNYYHLDTALTVLDGNTIAYYPAAFSPGSRAVLQRLFPDAITATDAAAAVFGLNAVPTATTSCCRTRRPASPRCCAAGASTRSASTCRSFSRPAEV